MYSKTACRACHPVRKSVGHWSTVTLLPHGPQLRGEVVCGSLLFIASKRSHLLAMERWILQTSKMWSIDLSLVRRVSSSSDLELWLGIQPAWYSRRWRMLDRYMSSTSLKNESTDSTRCLTGASSCSRDSHPAQQQSYPYPDRTINHRISAGSRRTRTTKRRTKAKQRVGKNYSTSWRRRPRFRSEPVKNPHLSCGAPAQCARSK
jgi:hypothetical protein